MKTKSNILACIVIAAAAACLNASPTLITGTPADSLLSKPSGPSPSFGTLYDFNALTPNTTFNSNTYASSGVTISSPDGLLVEPYSTQSYPNELYDNSGNGTANIAISLTKGTEEIGIGIADSDGVPISIEALNSTGGVLGSIFSVTLPSTTVNAFNGYFAISDTSADIYGLKILQSNANANSSGLAVDDLQVATPEPATLGFLGLGALVLMSARLRRRA